MPGEAGSARAEPKTGGEAGARGVVSRLLCAGGDLTAPCGRRERERQRAVVVVVGVSDCSATAGGRKDNIGVRLLGAGEAGGTTPGSGCSDSERAEPAGQRPGSS